MTTVGARVRLMMGMLVLGPLAAAGCLNRQPFDMAVVHRGSAFAGITHPGGGTAGVVRVGVAPAEDGGCYEVPGDLRVTVNGVPATAIELNEESISDAPTSPCDQFQHTTLATTIMVADTTQPMSIDIAQGNDRAVMELQPLPHPPLELTWDGTLEGSADGSETSAELVPLSGDPRDVMTGVFCWDAWLCPPGSDTSCALHDLVDVTTSPSSAGALLTLRSFHESPGDRSLWVSGSATQECRALAVSACSGLATCSADSDNYRDLLGPYPFHVR